jgi:hypothetical protein
MDYYTYRKFLDRYPGRPYGHYSGCGYYGCHGPYYPPYYPGGGIYQSIYNSGYLSGAYQIANQYNRPY